MAQAKDKAAHRLSFTSKEEDKSGESEGEER